MTNRSNNFFWIKLGKSISDSEMGLGRAIMISKVITFMSILNFVIFVILAIKGKFYDYGIYIGLIALVFLISNLLIDKYIDRAYKSALENQSEANEKIAQIDEKMAQLDEEESQLLRAVGKNDLEIPASDR